MTNHERIVRRCLCREIEDLEGQLANAKRQVSAITVEYERQQAELEDARRELAKWKPAELLIVDAIVETFGKAGQ